MGKFSEEVKPDGSICTTTLEYSNGKLQKNATKCTEPKSATTRRLQLMPPFEMPLADPMEDVWVLGGIFLERYVTIFDFDNAQIGFAEPVNKVAPVGLGTPNTAAYLYGNSVNDATQWSWVPMVLIVLTVCTLLALVSFYVWKKKTEPSGSNLPMFNHKALPAAESFELERLE